MSERSGVVDETGNVACYVAVKHGTDPDELPGKNAGVDGGFGEVADYTAEKLHVRLKTSVGIFHDNGSVRVFQVAVARPRSEVDPGTDVRMSQKSVVLFIGVRFYG